MTEREYLNSLKPGDKVIETGQSMLTGLTGTIYISDSPTLKNAICVKWSNGLATSITHGTRRLGEEEIELEGGRYGQAASISRKR